MKPILLFGSSGQVGRELQRTLASLGPLVMPDRTEGDLGNLSAVNRVIRDAQPRLIVNAAAYTAVDRAEAEPDLAWRINAQAPGVLGEESRRLGIPLLHYSTDYVFDGTKATPYVESDAPNPLSSYGRSKLAGELAVVASGTRGAILRTSWVFGAHGANFVRTVLRLAAERDTLRVVSDQVGAPTPAALIAEVTAQMIRLLDKTGWHPAEVYHLCARGETSWHGFAREIVASAWRQGRAPRLRPDAVEAITSAEYPTAARRPLNSRLDCSNLERAYGVELPGWARYLDDVLSVTNPSD